MQSVGKIPVDVRALGVDLLSLSAHKFNGPKGAGALWIKRGTRVDGDPDRRQARAQPPRRHRERPGIAGLGVAARARAAASSTTEAARARRAARSPRARDPGAASPARPSTARATPRVPNTTNISFDGVEAESLLIALDLEGIAVSTGSACSSGTLEPSHVLRAMGLPAHRTQNSIRFSLGAGNTDERGRLSCSAMLPAVVEKLRSAHASATVAEPAADRALTSMRIVVAMSGGVDSSVAAALLAERATR